MESDIAFHLLHHLVDVAIEHSQNRDLLKKVRWGS
jgi:hypothetical protein